MTEKTVTLAGRVEARLTALNITRVEAARRAGLQKTFLHDLHHRRKRTVHPKAFIPLAIALECSVEYLKGEQNEPGEPPAALPVNFDQFLLVSSTMMAPERGAKAQTAWRTAPVVAELPLAGVCEFNIWRSRDEPAPNDVVPICPDPRFSNTRQVAYRVRSKPMRPVDKLIGNGEKQYVAAVDYETFTENSGKVMAGDLLVVEREGALPGFIETAVREVVLTAQGLVLRARFSGEARHEIKLDEPGSKVLGVCVRYVQLLR